jgi:gamma-glutamylcyclotransferase (GGCT)/AIG2-like uncharacterized protein YtfP
MTNRSEFLFTYGTLLKDSAHPMSVFLQQHAQYVSQGYFQGRLYKVGDFAGAVPSEVAEDRVYGHIFHLSNVRDVLAVLDEYEGARAGSNHRGLFRREIVKVLADGLERSCWVYLYNLPVDGLEVIAAGDYGAWRASRQ